MNRSTTRHFYQRYFMAIQRAGRFLSWISASQRLRMLEDIMQWDMTYPVTWKP